MATTSNSDKQHDLPRHFGKLKVKQLIDELGSGNQDKISASIKALQANGDITVLEPMVGLLLTDISAKTQADVIEFLSSLKDTDAVDEVLRIVKDSTYLSVRRELLSTMWNSPLDYSYYLPEFVEIAIEGSFMEALDCLTIIENMNGPFEERHILESKLHLKKYMEDNEPKDPQKAHFISEIAILIKDYDLMEDEEDNLFEE